jgi:hypothetical protein
MSLGPRCLHLVGHTSSSLAFAASLMTFSRCRVGLQGFRLHNPSASFVRTTGSVPHGLDAAFRAPSVTLNRSDPVRLSWDSFSLCVLHPTCLPCVHSPTTLPPSFGQVAAKRLTCSTLVVSHHLDGLLRTGASGLLHPETGQDSLRFPACSPPMADRSRRLMVAHRCSPQRGSHPSKNTPRP